MSSDKFHPTWATKPKPPAPYASATDDAPYAAAKPPQYDSNVGTGAAPVFYRPQRASSPKRRRSRSCCCSCLLITSLFVVTLVILAAITSAVLYAIYRPHRPTFSLSSIHISSLNLSSTTAFSSNLSLSLSTHNPNSKISFLYDPFTVSVLDSSSSSVQIAAGKLPAFIHPTKNTTRLATSVTNKGLSIHSTQIAAIKSSVKRDKGLKLEIQLDSKARLRIGKSTSKKLAFRVSCTGIKVTTTDSSKEKFSGTVKTSDVDCKTNLSFKIWKWNL